MLGPSTLSHVELSIKCRKLPDKDVFSKSDPMGVLLEKDDRAPGGWVEVERTDVVANSLDPDFPRPLHLVYNFERLQHMRLVLYDVDTNLTADPSKINPGDQDFLAEGSFLLSDVLTARGQTLVIPLCDRTGRTIPGCKAILGAEEMPNTNAVVSMQLSAVKLENKDTFSKSDPFVRVSKQRENGDWIPVLKTEVRKNNLNPVWAPIQASMAHLCNCDTHRPLLLEVYDAESNGKHDLIGEAHASLHELQAASAENRGLPVVNPKRTGRPGYTSSGTLVVRGLKVVPRPSFLDYVAGGCQINFLVAIDYTASNGDPRNPTSLHYLSPRPTVYEDAIAAVGHVLEHYDTDKKYPCFGFGAALPGTGAASHCFALNGNPSAPEVDGVQGILSVYRHALSSVRLSGPTLFAPVISAAAQMARQSAASSQLSYYVLLILTDGCIMDMANTLTEAVNASQLPLSLLIVGVGNEDFAAMEVLDGDMQRIRAPDGRQTARDCVQFVPFRPGQLVGEALAAQLLAELPGQVVEYFHDIRRIPPPARTAPPSQFGSFAAGGSFGAAPTAPCIPEGAPSGGAFPPPAFAPPPM
eukprot:scaffold24.g2975.t1